MSNLVSSTLSSHAFLMVNKVIAKQVGNNAAILLADLISKRDYFKSRNELREDGSFFNISEKIEQDTGLRKDARQSATKKLIEVGFMNVSKEGMPSKNYYLIRDEVIKNVLEASDNQRADIPSTEDKNEHITDSKENNPVGGKPSANKNIFNNIVLTVQSELPVASTYAPAQSANNKIEIEKNDVETVVTEIKELLKQSIHLNPKDIEFLNGQIERYPVYKCFTPKQKIWFDSIKHKINNYPNIQAPTSKVALKVSSPKTERKMELNALFNNCRELWIEHKWREQWKNSAEEWRLEAVGALEAAFNECLIGKETYANELKRLEP